MPTRLDELERKARFLSERHECKVWHFEIADVAALVEVARITIKRRRNALDRARTTGEAWDRLDAEDLLLMEQEAAALTPLLAEVGLMSIGCCICGKGPRHQVTLYRANAPGNAAVWACELHLQQPKAPPPAPEVVEIVGIISGDKTEPSAGGEGAGHG